MLPRPPRQQTRKRPKKSRVLPLVFCIIAGLVLGAPFLTSARDDSNASLTTSSQQPFRDGLWQLVDNPPGSESQANHLPINVNRTLRVNRSRLEEILGRAPLEFSDDTKSREVRISLPFPDGSFQTFRIEESPVMAPELARRYPEIKTYRGQSLDDPTAVTRFDCTPQGFHAVILSGRGTVFIEPYSSGNTSDYVAYFQKDVNVNSFACETTDGNAAGFHSTKTRDELRGEVSNGATLRTYRLAVAATAEYTQQYGGGTVSGGLAAVVTTVNGVNTIYEREVAARFVLIPNNDSIIFTDAATDGYTSDNVGLLIGENQTKLDTVIGTANYDFGHVFDGRADQPGFFSFQGQASIATVCRDGVKARGVTITRSSFPSHLVTIYIVAHEMGHQFSATHTFNANTGTCAAQRTASSAYEPGTGSTIMGYRFACGAEDLMSQDLYFHNNSLEQIVSYTNNASGNTCAVQTATGNQPPTVNAGPNFTIPQGTPFTLTASAQDPDGDQPVYCWEQFDLGAAAPPDTDDGFRPIFRSFTPTLSPSRTFPNLNEILTGVPAFGESLPTTTRTLNFRVTVRDTHGGIGSGAMQVNVRSDIGPFAIIQPAAGVNWGAGSQQTVTWSVANTTDAPVSCTAVRITMSTDGGFTFPIVLAAATPNDGNEVITIPTIPSGNDRVRIEALGNIFFTISRIFTVTGSGNGTPTISGFTPTSGPAGTTVTITGTNFIQPSAVRFNGTPAAFILNSTTEIVASVPPGASTGPISVITPSGTATSAANFTVIQPANFMQFSSASYPVNENGNSVTITVQRTGDVGNPSSIDYATSDASAQQRTDYTVSAGTLTFGTGEVTKTFTVLIVDDLYVESNEQLNLTLTNPVAGNLGATNTATVTINDNDIGTPTTNPLDSTAFFIRQHYYDFLNRNPDPGGLAFWIFQIDGACASPEVRCLNRRRREVSDAFFFEPEFQQTGGYVFRLYRAAFGNDQPFPNPDQGNLTEAKKIPSYAAFIADRAKVIAGPGLANSQLALANALVQRPEFVARFPTSLTGPAFIDSLLGALIAQNGVSLHSQRDALNNQFNLGGRGMVLYRIAEDSPQNPINNSAFIDAEYRRTFVYTEYAGYLRRDSDVGGFLFWLNQVNQFPVRDTGIQHIMACAFITSAEYQQRFSSVVTRSNAECGQ